MCYASVSHPSPPPPPHTHTHTHPPTRRRTHAPIKCEVHLLACQGQPKVGHELPELLAVEAAAAVLVGYDERALQRDDASGAPPRELRADLHVQRLHVDGQREPLVARGAGRRGRGALPQRRVPEQPVHLHPLRVRVGRVPARPEPAVARALRVVDRLRAGHAVQQPHERRADDARAPVALRVVHVEHLPRAQVRHEVNNEVRRRRVLQHAAARGLGHGQVQERERLPLHEPLAVAHDQLREQPQHTSQRSRVRQSASQLIGRVKHTHS